jgi:hypothetical protein
MSVAINPLRLLLDVFQRPPNDQIYGYMWYDPLEKPKQGDLNASNRVDPKATRNHVLVFLLNAMARYWDYNQLGFINDIGPPTTYQEILMLGVIGPFGIAFPNNSGTTLNEIITLRPDWRLPLIKLYNPILPVQCDGYNCGIYIIFFMLDFMKTQRNFDFSFKNIKSDASNLYVHGKTFHEHLATLLPIFLPPSNRLGCGFCSNPTAMKGAEAKYICELIRIELLTLMERAHCLYVNTFSEAGKRVNSTVVGVLAPAYSRIITQSKLVSEYIAILDSEVPRKEDITEGTEMNEKEKELFIRLTNDNEKLLTADYYSAPPTTQFQSYATALYEDEKESKAEQIKIICENWWASCGMFRDMTSASLAIVGICHPFFAMGSCVSIIL